MKSFNRQLSSGQYSRHFTVTTFWQQTVKPEHSLGARSMDGHRAAPLWSLGRVGWLALRGADTPGVDLTLVACAFRSLGVSRCLLLLSLVLPLFLLLLDSLLLQELDSTDRSQPQHRPTALTCRSLGLKTSVECLSSRQDHPASLAPGHPSSIIPRVEQAPSEHKSGSHPPYLGP